jgi:hypothetical protein
MEAFIEHMRTSADAHDLQLFVKVGKHLVRVIGAMPIREQLVQDVLKCLDIVAKGPHGAEELDRGRGLLRAADDNQWDQFCRQMWLYTIPNKTFVDVFSTMEGLLLHTVQDDDSRTRLQVLQDLCQQFNRELGWRCAEHGTRLIADARQAAATAGQTGRMFVEAQDVESYHSLVMLTKPSDLMYEVKTKSLDAKHGLVNLPWFTVEERANLVMPTLLSAILEW